MLVSRLSQGRAGLPKGARALALRFLSTQSSSLGDSPPFLQKLVHESITPSYGRFAFENHPTSLPVGLAKKQSNPAQTILQYDVALSMLAVVQHSYDDMPPLRNKTAVEPTQMYKPRTLLVHRLIGLGRVLSAMTAFTADLKNPTRLPYTIQDLELIMRALRAQSKQHGSGRPPRVKRALKGPLWRPPLLDPSFDPRSFSVPLQCVYAMAAVYDTCIELDLQVTSKIVSPLLSTFLNHLRSSHMFLVAQTTMNTLYAGRDGVRSFSHGILSSLLLIFGEAGKPEVGEQLLHKWAMDYAEKTPQGSVTPASAMGTNLSGWGHNTVLWTCLIQSRSSAKDFRGARAWLDLYRKTRLPTMHTSNGVPISASTREPYLACMAGLKKAYESDTKLSTSRYVLTELRSIVELLLHDQVPVDDTALALVLDILISVGDVHKSVNLLTSSHISEASKLYTRPAILHNLFRLRVAVIHREKCSSSVESSDSPNMQHLPTTRYCIMQLIYAGELNAPASESGFTHSRFKHRGMLHDALKAALAERDYPAAFVIFDAFRTWNIQLTTTTFGIVLSSLVEQGHQACFVETDAISDCRDSEARPPPVINKDEILRIAAQTAPWQGERDIELRYQALRAAQARGDVSIHVSTSAAPSHAIDTNYFQLLLKRACISEIQTASSSPNWLPDLIDLKLPASELAQHAIASSQRDIIGAREYRRTRRASANGVVEWKGSFSRHTQFESRSEPQKRMFSTKPVSGSEASHSASCNLVTANDHAELEPVRVQYLPGFVPYNVGLALQEHLVKQRSEARAALRASSSASSTSAGIASGHHSIEPSASEAALNKVANQDTLLLLQHRPVYTEGRREENENALMSKHLRSLGADYALTKRGGQITYHGPGQLVGYPILNLGAMDLASRCYVNRVQDTLISMLAEQGILTVDPPENHTGVWTDEYHKIASIGIQVRHRISSHGFALNVEPRSMRGFQHIVACGIVGRSMTCIGDHIAANDQTHTMTVPDAARLVTRHFATVFGRRTRPTTAEEFVFQTNLEDAPALMAGLGIPISDGEQVVTAITVDGKPVLV